jgi:excisionase family DNA binding protein
MPPKLLTPKEAAQALALSQRTLARWIALRQIEIVRLGRAVRIRESELHRLIEVNTQPVARVWKSQL